MKASDFAERKLSKGEEKEKERIVKGMKKAKASFKDRYGKDAEAVMYATATKLAKENVDKDGTPICPDACCGVPVSECTCGPQCKHCNCHFIKSGLKEYVFTKKDFLDNEAENLHSENAVELAKKFGTPKEIKQMDDILTRHMKRGHITPEDMETRDALVRKYYSMLEGKKEDDYEEKKKALQDIQADPNTAKDPELKKELIRRKAELEKLKEEMDWKLNESLMEGFEKEVMLVMKDNGISGFFNKGTLYVDGDLETVERAKELLQMNFQYTDDVEVKQERDYYNEDEGLQGSVTPQTISKEFPGVADKNNLVQALLKMKRGDTNYSRNQMIAAADAFKELLSKDPQETQKLMMMLKRVKAKEEVASDINDKWKEYQK